MKLYVLVGLKFGAMKLYVLVDQSAAEKGNQRMIFGTNVPDDVGNEGGESSNVES
jgi:hypothetical protein